MTIYKKRLSFMEKMYLLFDELRPPFCNQLVVEGTGRLRPRDLEEALIRSSQVNPGSTLRLRGTLGHMEWVAGPDPPLRVIRGSSWDGWSERGAPFLHERIDPRAGPGCELQYVEAGPRTFLIFRSLHAVMDGVGHRAWVRDFFTALGGDHPKGHPDVLCSTRVASSVTSETLRFPRGDALHPCGRADAPTSGNSYQWRRLTLKRPKGSLMLAQVALELARAARAHGEGPFRVSIPVDLRHYRPQARTTLNLIGALFLEVTPDDTPETFLARLREGLRRGDHARLPPGYPWWSWLPLPLVSLLLRRAFRSEHTTGRYSISATISDLGSFAPSDCSVAGFSPGAAFFIPPFADQHCFVTLNGFADRTDLLLAIPSVLASRSRLEHLLASLELRLADRATEP